MESLYQQLGGAAAVEAAVDGFYNKVLADDRLRHFFEGVDMSRQAAHQKRFLTYAFGGSEHYPGKSMRQAHQRLVDELGLADQHFDAVVENLAATLEELSVPAELIQQVAGIAESIRDEVLCR